uniref:Protein TIFY n=1 Tax=Solanum chacoense TaxID=4108 RepID=A0A0V0H5Z1_SOLCH
MTRSAEELDFFGMEKEATATKLVERRRSFRDIQTMISKINPEVLKNVIASRSAEKKNIYPIAPSSEGSFSLSTSSLPLLANCNIENDPENSPLTIFYNGIVAIFDVTKDKAENILRLAQGGNQQLLLKTSHVDGDLPITRKKSLERFFEKRKERMTMVSPYGFNELPSNKLAANQN